MKDGSRLNFPLRQSGGVDPSMHVHGGEREAPGRKDVKYMTNVPFGATATEGSWANTGRTSSRTANPDDRFVLTACTIRLFLVVVVGKHSW